VRKVIEGK